MKRTDSLFSGLSYQSGLKRLMDIFIALGALSVFILPAILIAVAIKLTSRGPVFADVPSRIGQHGRTFRMYKFRSMIENAHQLLRNDPRFKKLYAEYKRGSYKLVNDPRITPVGRFIRKHSLDELPQLLNVLRGDMSIVGPRAYYPDELENQQRTYPGTKKMVKTVLMVKPGITGLWQVSGRSEVNFDERIVMDARYVETISLVQDLKIIVKTPLIMITGKGAV